MANKARFVINIETGSVLFRNEATDEIPVIFRLIDDDTANAIVHGEISAGVVIDAIYKSDTAKEGFSWREYDRARQNAKKMMNVSERDMRPAGDDSAIEEKDDDEGSVIHLSDIKAKPETKKQTRKREEKTESQDASTPGELEGILS